MRIGFTYTINKHWREHCSPLMEKYPHHEFVTEKERVLQELETFEVLITGIEPREVYERATILKAVFVPFVGIDHMPLKEFNDRGVRVFNSHGNARFVAERTLALILSCAGKIVEYHQDLSRGRWHGWVGKGLSDTWDSIVGSTVAILGAGAIAQWVARYLKAFDCRVVCYRKRITEPLPEVFDRAYSNLEEAVTGAEIVVSTLPLTEETKGLVGNREMALLKGKILVNVGRGEVIDEEALYQALKDGVLKGAGIDTWYSYPSKGEPCHYPSRFPFQDLPNLVLSPHVGGFTPKAILENIRVTVSNLDAYLSGKPVPNEVDLGRMY